MLIGCYAYGYAFGRGEQAQSLGAFTGALNAIDFGSGQERGIRGAARERYFEKLAADKRDTETEEEERASSVAGDVPTGE